MGEDDPDDSQFLGIRADAIMACSAVKYWTAAVNGPRDPGQRPHDLAAAAEKIIEGFELSWRAGYNRTGVLMAEVIRVIASRRAAK
jgi:hypothetical protein